MVENRLSLKVIFQNFVKPRKEQRTVSGHLERMIEAFEEGKLTRRQLVAQIGAFAAAVVGMERMAAAAKGGKPASTFQAVGLNHIALSVTDVARSRDWYKKHLGLKVIRDGEQSCFMSSGEQFVALFRSPESGMDHYCYTIPEYDPGKAVETLKAAGLEPRRHENRVYFDDPDGLTVQVAGKNNWP